MSIFSKASNASYWRGFDYYEHHHVFDIKKISEDIYTGIVKGTTDYEVKVDLNHPLKSSCTCPFVQGNRKICKHMIALAFCISPKEVKTANKIREDYFNEKKKKKTKLNKIMEAKTKEINEYLDSLSKEELREVLFKRLINHEYEIAYQSVYGYDEDFYDEYDDEPYLDEENDYDDVEEYEEPIKLSNGITDWKVGDTLVHQKFGEGVVTKLLGNNILEVVFSDNNKKVLLGSHYMVSRK